MQQSKVASVNISKAKGTIKQPVDFIEIDEQGVVSDAHSGYWNRQISLLGLESIEKFGNEAGRTFHPGEFAENITTTGLTLYKTHPLDRLIIGETELEVTQIGKGCHGDGCAIYREIGNCVMPKEGIFCRTIKKGKIYPGDPLVYIPKVIRVFVLTLSDRASRSQYEDRSGPRITEITSGFFKTLGFQIHIDNHLIPDDASMLRQLLSDAREKEYDLVFTTGGTGIGPRDITPDVTMKMLDKEIPGVMDHIRLKFGQDKPGVLLSRAVAGLMGNTLVFNLPGSVRAVEEYFAEISKNLKHMLYMIHGLDLHG